MRNNYKWYEVETFNSCASFDVFGYIASAIATLLGSVRVLFTASCLAVTFTLYGTGLHSSRNHNLQHVLRQQDSMTTSAWCCICRVI